MFFVKRIDRENVMSSVNILAYNMFCHKTLLTAPT